MTNIFRKITQECLPVSLECKFDCFKTNCFHSWTIGDNAFLTTFSLLLFLVVYNMLLVP